MTNYAYDFKLPIEDIFSVTFEVLNMESLVKEVADNSVGAIVTFSGTTRDTFKEKMVIRLEYEAYVPMAEAELKRIGREARKKWTLHRIGIWHRIGQVPVGETSVLIAVSSVHRKAALEATSYIIDALKLRVPIWKKEVLATGEAEWRANT
ncbi:Molybdopterin biosynthesis MoaE [Syncephalis plumigaleata]|nr:Molybdopterin biosynthesis MoaE [Syncephalis plumigaleata]